MGKGVPGPPAGGPHRGVSHGTRLRGSVHKDPANPVLCQKLGYRLNTAQTRPHRAPDIIRSWIHRRRDPQAIQEMASSDRPGKGPERTAQRK